MKKRYVALLCIAALVLSVFALNIKAEAATNYLVGYSIKDINPWLDPEDHSKGLIENITMKGRGTIDSTRFVTHIHDDDGDGNVVYTYDGTDANVGTMTSWTPDPDGGDGIHATCIAITDAKGTTLLFISIDVLGAYSGLVSDAKTAIYEALGGDVIDKDNIIINGSHTHSSFDFSDGEMFRDEEARFGEYYDYVISQIAASAVEAMADRASAAMSMGSQNAGDVAQSDGEKYQLNFVRHYQRETYNYGDYDENGVLKEYATPYEIDFVQGSNFGTINGLRSYISQKLGVPAQPYYSSEYRKTLGVTFDTVEGVSGYQATKLADADDTMHLIKFDFGADSEKQPIVMLNWRAHATENGGDFFGAVSSDYIGPLRAMMKKNGFRMSYFLSNSGDIIINQFNSSAPADTPWRNLINKSEGVATESDTNAYGRALYTVAAACLKDNMSPKTPGDILTSVTSFTFDRQVDSEGLRAAVEAVKAEHPDDFNKVGDYYPYYHQHTDGKTYIINSYFHASSINGRMNNVEGDTGAVSITAVTLGNEAAFLAVPFEMADRYDSVDPLDDALNDWLDLSTKGGYGTPFLISCANGYSGYIPYSTEFIFNTEEYAEKTGKNAEAMLVFGAGSYEANVTAVAQDTGVKLVAHMLDTLKIQKSEIKTGYCEHCKETVTWKPFNNNTAEVQYEGHYYLTEDIVEGPRVIIYKGHNACFDLNGKTYSAKEMAFHTFSDGPVLSILDSVGTGKVIGHSRVGYTIEDSTQYRGGTLVASSDSTINIYGGTYSFEAVSDEEAVPLSQGGVLCVLGTVNMYAGNIIGADLEVTDWTDEENELPEHNGYGAAVYVGDLPGSALNISSGTITAGTVPESGEGRCVILAGGNSRLNLSGDAVIDEIMLMNITNRAQLNVTGEFTGSATVALCQAIAYAGTDGNSIGAHTDAVMNANAMRFVTYAKEDPNTPIAGAAIIIPDMTPDKNFDNRTLLRVRIPKYGPCQACGTDVDWQPVYNTIRIPSDANGHYYLAEDITAENGKRIVATRDHKICLNLNGKTYEVNDTAIHPYQYATINVMDMTTDKLGKIISHPGTQTTGGVILLSANSSVSIYAGTYAYEPTQSAPAGVVSGGIAYINNTGVLNVYGGKLVGTTIVNPGNTDVSTPGLGGTVTVLYGGKLNVAGGQLTSGVSASGKGDCVYLAAKGSRLELSGSGSIEEVYANWSDPDMITVNGAYTGVAELYFNPTNAPLSNDLDIGNSVNASFYVANLWIANSNDYSIKVSGTDLLLSTDKKAAIYTSETDPSPMTYATLEDALSVYDSGFIRLLDHHTTGDVTVDKTAILDLNGKSIQGTVTVVEGKTLYCGDCVTDDYDIEDGIYGKIKAVSGDVVGMSARVEGSKDYLKVTESDGVSFHRVNLTLTHITLTPENASVKYKGAFEGDRLVAENVKQFGIAYHLTEAPNATNLTPETYSRFTDFKPGEDMNGTYASTSVVNVMKTDRTDYHNGMNAKRSVHGSAYILTNDDEYLFGPVVSRSFREVVIETDEIWDTLNDDQKNAVVELYKRFESNMQYWGLENIMAAAQ